MTDIQTLHQRALRFAQDHRQAEAGLIDTLILIDNQKGYADLGYASLYQYCREGLSLSETHSYALIGIARKSKDVPLLKEKIRSGEIHLSNARKVVAVLQPSNQEFWLKSAATLTQKELEREIVKVRPELEVPERIRALSAERSELRLGISRELEEKIQRAKDLLSQKQARAVATEEALLAALDLFLQRQDPIEKAMRRRELGVRPVAVDAIVDGERKSMPSAIAHAVARRDERQCTARLPSGRRCEQRRWVEVHHVRPVAQGGVHSIENLTTLCHGHHRQLHNESSALGVS